MKHLKSALIGAAAGITAFGLSITAFAATADISVHFDNIRIFIDGNEFTPEDTEGNVIEPFTYNGTAYLPVRAIADAFGQRVEWSEEYKSIYIGYPPIHDSGFGAFNGSGFQMAVPMGGWIVVSLNNPDAPILFDHSGDGSTIMMSKEPDLTYDKVSQLTEESCLAGLLESGIDAVTYAGTATPTVKPKAEDVKITSFSKVNSAGRDAAAAAFTLTTSDDVYLLYQLFVPGDGDGMMIQVCTPQGSNHDGQKYMEKAIESLLFMD